MTTHVQAACLYIATKLGDLMEDLVVVGGLVPSLIVSQHELPVGAERHVGTMDLDIGLSVLLLNRERYKAVGARLRAAGFRPDQNEKGNSSRQRWVFDQGPSVTVDFLMGPTLEGDRPGSLRDLEPDFAAFIIPGMQLAFEDSLSVLVTGKTPFDERASRTIRVCGPGAYVVLKALAFRMRGENKDAYDLFYVVRNYGSGVDDVARCLVPLLSSEPARRALEYLREDFGTTDALGPTRTAHFVTGSSDEAIQAEVFGFVTALLDAVARLESPD